MRACRGTNMKKMSKEDIQQYGYRVFVGKSCNSF